jgi:hypothetical protein
MLMKILIVMTVMGIPQMVRGVALWFRAAGGCRVCRVLGQLPSGPPYWLLKKHLRKAGA